MPKHRTKTERERVIEQMKTALEQPDSLCKIVCFEAGFREDTGTRYFKRHTGMTPGQWKERHGKGVSQ